MYEKLVESLRNCVADENGCCFRCPEDCNGPCQENLMTEAADAIEELSKQFDDMNEANIALYGALPKWIPVTEDTPSDFVSVQAHMTDAGQFPSVREAYTVDGLWFFPALKEFHPVDAWKRFDEPPKEE